MTIDNQNIKEYHFRKNYIMNVLLRLKKCLLKKHLLMYFILLLKSVIQIGLFFKNV